MDHNKLYLALENKAINTESSKIQTAINNFKAALRHPNGCTLTYNKKFSINIAGKSVPIGIDDFLSAIKAQLLGERKGSVIDREIQTFMNAHASYTKGLKTLEQYLEDDNDTLN